MTMRERSLRQDQFADFTRECLEHATGLSFRARGGSMVPLIRHGDLVTLRRCGRKSRVGDVVLTRRGGGRLLLHRVAAVTPEGIVTRGDALSHRDQGVVPHEDILGRAVRVTGRGFSFHLRFPWGFLVARLCRLIQLIQILGPSSLGWKKVAAFLDRSPTRG